MDRNAKRQLGVPVADPVTSKVEAVPEMEVVEETKVEEVVITGSVTAEKLNVREEPVVDPNNILGTIDKGVEVIIDVEESTDDFYKVCTAKGLEGFCMKQYIQVD